MILRILLLAAVSLLLTGCFENAAQGPSFATARKPEINNELATLYIYRWGERANLHPDTELFINGESIGTLSYAGFTWLQLPPGKYTVEEKLPWSKRPLFETYRHASQDVELKAGERQFINVYFWTRGLKQGMELNIIGGIPIWAPSTSVDASGSKMELVPERRALKEIRYCSYQDNTASF